MARVGVKLPVLAIALGDVIFLLFREALEEVVLSFNRFYWERTGCFAVLVLEP